MPILTLPTLVTLSEVLESTAAVALVTELQSLRGQSVEVSAHSVGRVSTLCIQVLLSAATTWMMDGIAFRVCAPSVVFLEAIRQLGLGEEEFAIERNAA